MQMFTETQHLNRLQDGAVISLRNDREITAPGAGKGVPLLKVNNNSGNRRIGAPIEAWTNARIMSGDRNSEPAVN